MDGQDNNPLNVNPATDNNQPTPADAILAEPVDVAPAQPSNNPEPAPNVTTPTVDTSGDTEPNNIIATPGIITSAPVETVTPDAGDIIIGGNSTSQAPSKGRKIAVIAGLVALIVVIIISGIIMASGGFGGKKHTTEKVQILNAQKSFSRYANYLLYGEEKDTLEGEYNNSLLYKLDDELENSGESDYWNKVLDLLTVAIDDINKIDDNREQIESIIQDLQSQYNNIDFLSFFRQVNAPSDEEIIMAYVTSGADGIRNLQAQSLQPIAGMTSQPAQSYSSLAEISVENTIKELDIYNNYGCIDNYAINTICSNNVLNSSAGLNELLEQNVSLAETFILMFKNITTKVEGSCWSIWSELKNMLGDSNI